MTKTLLIIPQQNFNDIEYSETRHVLEENKIDVTVASITTEEATSMQGKKITPDRSVRECTADEYDILVIIGGPGSPKLAEYPEVLILVRRFNEKKKLVAAICLAPIILGKAGILKGVIATVYPVDWAIASLQRDGAQYSNKPVVVDANIITADGPDSAEKFGMTIAEKLKEI